MGDVKAPQEWDLNIIIASWWSAAVTMQVESCYNGYIYLAKRNVSHLSDQSWKFWMCWCWRDTTLHTSPLYVFKLSQKPSGLTFFPPLSPSLPCAEIIGWHALMALSMTCFMKTASCIELGVCKGEFCFFALLGTGQRCCLISGRSQPGRLAVFPRFWKI